MSRADLLRSGLEKLGPEFSVRLCTACAGEGKYNQTYTAGCGGGHYRAVGPCDFCSACGLVYKASGIAAPQSIVNQVIVAGNYDGSAT